MRALDFYPADEASWSSTVAVMPYPIAGTPQNTSARYAKIAELTGFDIIGVQREGANRLMPYPALRKQLSPSEFDEHCAIFAERIKPWTDNYDSVVVHGESTSGFDAVGIAASGVLRATHVSLIDPGNLKAPQNFWDSKISYINYLAAKKVRPIGEALYWSDSSERKTSASYKVKEVIGFVNELFYYDRVWRTSYVQNKLLEVVVNNPDLPIQVVLCGNGPYTNPELAEAYKQQLLASRNAQSNGAAIKVETLNQAWHDYLLNPYFSAEKLITARSLTSHTK